MANNVPTNLAGLSRIMAWLSGVGLVLCPLIVAATFLLPGGATGLVCSTRPICRRF